MAIEVDGVRLLNRFAWELPAEAERQPPTNPFRATDRDVGRPLAKALERAVHSLFAFALVDDGVFKRRRFVRGRMRFLCRDTRCDELLALGFRLSGARRRALGVGAPTKAIFTPASAEGVRSREKPAMAATTRAAVAAVTTEIFHFRTGRM